MSDEKSIIQSQAERIAKLEAETATLRQVIAAVGLAELQHLNLLVAIMGANKMKETLTVQDDKKDAYTEFGLIFDRVYNALQGLHDR